MCSGFVFESGLTAALRAGGHRPQRRQLREGGRAERRVHWYVCVSASALLHPPACSVPERLLGLLDLVVSRDSSGV
jgi:hypothetical protein